jgi:uncharacterized membrane protein
MTALIVVAASLDRFVIAYFFPTPPAVVTILVVMALLQIFAGEKRWSYLTAIFCGTAWGIVSLIFATFTAPIFVYPWISVFPRVMVGVICYPIFAGLLKAFKNSKNGFLKNIIPRSIGAATGAIVNTTLVLTMWGLTAWLTDDSGFQAFADIIALIISINFLIEFLFALILVPLISYPVSRASLKFRIGSESSGGDQTVFDEKSKSSGGDQK